MVKSIDTQRLWEMLDYNPSTGIFRWKKSLKGGAKQGGIADYVDSRGYVSIRIDGELFYAHRLAWQYINGVFVHEIDHKNGNPNDNRIENLRISDRQGQGANSRRPSHNTSGYKGVSWEKRRKKWRAHITIDGKMKHLGQFDTAEEAHEVYVKAAREAFKDFAKGG